MFHLGQPSRQWPRICFLVEDVYDVSDLTLSGFGNPHVQQAGPPRDEHSNAVSFCSDAAAVEGCSPDRQLPSWCDRSVGRAARVPRGGRQAQGLKARFPAVGRGAAAETRALSVSHQDGQLPRSTNGAAGRTGNRSGEVILGWCFAVHFLGHLLL